MIKSNLPLFELARELARLSRGAFDEALSARVGFGPTGCFSGWVSAQVILAHRKVLSLLI